MTHQQFRHQRSLTAGLLLLMAALYAPAQTVDVWLTTQDQGSKLEPQPPVAFAPGSGGNNPVFLDETQTYQEIEGFGASFTDSAAYLLNQVATPSARAEAMSNLFTRVGDGIGVSFIRNPMGASDLARFHYSYDDGPPDAPLANFSIAHDLVDIVPLIQDALLLNPQLTIMGSPWSPPGWMKDSGSMIGGALLPSMYASYADYFVKYVQAYEAEGIPVDYISLQNEPLYVPTSYPGMDMDAATQRDVLRDYVLPAFAAASLSTRVLVFDHNWDGSYYPDTVLSDPIIQASSQVAGTAWHGYGGTPGVMLGLAEQFPTKGNYQTEHSGGTWVGGDANQIATDFKEIIHCMRSEAKAFVKWSLVLDENRGPNAGGCDTCTPLVTVDSNTGAVSYPVDYYTLGHFSKFVLPGALRIYSANAAGIVSAAFLNPDGSKALVAFNDTTSSVTFQVQWGSQSFAYTLPGYAGATFTWSGAQSGGGALEADQQVQASSFRNVSGLLTESTSDTQGGYNLGYAANNDFAVYPNVNFIPFLTNLYVRVASFGGGTLEFRLGSPGGTLLGSVAMPNTGDWQNWQTVTAPASSVSGLYDLYLVYKGGGGGGLGNINWFRFEGAPPPGPATQFIWTTEPGLATNGIPFAQQPVLKTADQYGIPTTSGLPPTLDVEVALTAGTGPLVGTTTVDLGTGGLNGVAPFTDLQINAEGTGKELTASSPATTSVLSGNLLLNGDFNLPASGDPPNDWTTWTSGGVSWANHENNVGVTHDGSYYMVVGGQEGGGGGFHQTVPATAGRTYELSVLSGADTWWLPYGEMRLFFQNAAGGEVGYSFRPTLNPPDYGNASDAQHPWVPYTLTTVAPAGTTQVKVEFMSDEKGSIWYENAVLTELGSGSPLTSATTLPFTVEPAPPVSETNYIGGITLSGEGIFDLELVGTVGVPYYVQSTTNLLPPSIWNPIAGSTNIVTNTNGMWSLTVTNDGPRRFYRSSVAGPRCLGDGGFSTDP